MGFLKSLGKLGGSFLGGAMGLGGQLLSNRAAGINTEATNVANAKQAQLNREFQSAEATTARQFNAAESATVHQREVADLRAAGLNPLLSINRGSPAAHASAPSGAQATMLRKEQSFGDLGHSAAMSRKSAQLTQANLKATENQIKQTTSTAKATEKNITQDTLNKQQDVRSQQQGIKKSMQDVETSYALAKKLRAEGLTQDYKNIVQNIKTRFYSKDFEYSEVAAWIKFLNEDAGISGDAILREFGSSIRAFVPLNVINRLTKEIKRIK